MAVMGVLDGTAGLTDRPMTLLLSAETSALLVEKKVGNHGQRPEAKNGISRQELVVVETKYVLAIFKEDLNFPTHSNMLDQGETVSVQIAGRPEANGLRGAIQARANDDDLTTVQLANAGRADMDEDSFMFAVRPRHFLVSRCRQAERIIRQPLPTPALLSGGIIDPQPAVGF